MHAQFLFEDYKQIQLLEEILEDHVCLDLHCTPPTIMINRFHDIETT